jgi:hypothetical protein
MSRWVLVFFISSRASRCYSGLTIARTPKLPIKTSNANFRLIGFLPLIFFLAQAVHYWRINELGHLLWMCNIGNLLLAIGLFCCNRQLMRIAIIWTVPGVVIWLLYVVLDWGVFFTSTLAHVGGLIVGMFVLRQIGMARLTWAYAFVWFLAVQILSRVFTAPELNVNLAHKIQPGWESRFGAYWEFWAVLVIVIGVTLWVLEKTLSRLWPAGETSIESGERLSKVVSS